VAVPYANLNNPQTLNLYSMVADDPESFADLDGHTGSGGGENSSAYCGNTGPVFWTCVSDSGGRLYASSSDDREDASVAEDAARATAEHADDHAEDQEQTQNDSAQTDSAQNTPPVSATFDFVECPSGSPFLTVNGNPAKATPSGGVSLTLDADAAGVLSGAASNASGRALTFAPNSSITVDPLTKGGYGVGFNPALSVGLPGPDVKVNSINFGENGNVTKTNATYIGFSKGVSRAVTNQLNSALGKAFGAGKGIPGQLVRDMAAGLTGNYRGIVQCINVTMPAVAP